MVVTHVLLQSKLILANFVALFALIVCYLVDILDVVLQQDLVLEVFSTIVAYNLVLWTMDVSFVRYQVLGGCKKL